jgi:RNA polymerase sigma-70 factor, ECF subfamily
MSADESFLDQLKAGEPAAYALLVERFEGPLYRFFFCEHRNHHSAQDQTAETFVELVRSLGAMRGNDSQLRSYVFATARHVQLRGFRRRGKQASSLVDANDIQDESPSPLETAASREELERVLRAIANLERPTRNVLLLRFVEGCSIEEVAESLDLPVGTVKSHIHRSRERLKQIFAEKEK